MEKLEFVVGNEKEFTDFIRGIDGKSKIVAVSHTDLDGLASAKVVDFSMKPSKVFLIDYVDMNLETVEKIKKENPGHIIITDLMVENIEFITGLTKFAKVMIIDHHVPDFNLKMKNLTYLNAQNRCAAYIAYYLFSKIEEIDKLDWLVACASISDMQTKYIYDFMEEVFDKYGEDYDKNVKESKFWNLVIGISNSLIYYDKDKMKVYNLLNEKFELPNKLKEAVKLVQEDIDDAVKRFEMEKIPIMDGWYWEFSAKYSIKSIVTTIVSLSHPNKTILIGKIQDDKLMISARRQDKKEDMNKLLKKLIEGFEGANAGGHIPAAGGHIMLKDLEEFRKRLKNL